MAAFAATFGGAAFGMGIAPLLPQRHLSAETRTAISVSMAVVGTLTALVLSLLITQASTSFTARANAISGLASNIVRLDRVLQRSGPDAGNAQIALRLYARAKAGELSHAVRAPSETATLIRLEELDDSILELQPHDEMHAVFQRRALLLVASITEQRWLLAEKVSTAIPTPFLVLLIFWLTALFASFGLFAPRNGTILVALLLCAISISGGIYMIIALANPSNGLVRNPVDPLVAAVRALEVSK